MGRGQNQGVERGEVADKRAITRIGVIGAGAWGTALAQAARMAGREVVLWAREAALAQTINTRHENTPYLPGHPLDPAIHATDDLAAAAACDALLLVCPAQHLRAVLGRLTVWLDSAPKPLVLCCKGIEIATGALMSDVAREVLPGCPVAVLSGPTFAAEVAAGLPAALTLACADAALGRALVDALGSRALRPYLSDDLVGTQIGGAVKNVLAIACGIVAGRALGENARAALITRGLAEIARLGLALGARPDTLMGLSGLGDLALTCASLQSRNMSLGAALGQGMTLAQIMAGRSSVAEGVHTARAVVALAARVGVDMPICQGVDAILNGGLPVDAAINTLLSRPFKAEGV